MLVARLKGKPGQTLWTQSKKKTEVYENSNVNMSVYVTIHRFNDLKLYLPYMWADEGLKGSDDWWKIVRVFDWYAENRRRTVHASNTKLVNEKLLQAHNTPLREEPLLTLLGEQGDFEKWEQILKGTTN